MSIVMVQAGFSYGLPYTINTWNPACLTPITEDLLIVTDLLHIPSANYQGDPLEIVAYSESLHLQELTMIAHKMRQSEQAYPPREDCGESVEDVEAWLRGSTAFARWIAVHEGKVLGHIALQDPDDYLKMFLLEHEVTGQQSEISKFFVSPDCRKLGAGRLLFSHAVESSELQVALAVLNGSLAARAFYVHHGMTELGIYHGRSGINHIFLENRAALGEIAFPEPDLSVQVAMRA